MHVLPHETLGFLFLSHSILSVTRAMDGSNRMKSVHGSRGASRTIQPHI